MFAIAYHRGPRVYLTRHRGPGSIAKLSGPDAQCLNTHDASAMQFYVVT